MAFLRPEHELRLRDELKTFLERKFCGNVTPNKTVFPGFAPDYYLKVRNKQRIVIFRNPPTMPETWQRELMLALKNGIGVYIVIYNHEYDKLLECLSSKCETCGIGVIQYGIDGSGFSIVLPSLIDYPAPDKLTEGLVKVFLSSKLWIVEREAVRKSIRRLRHQPVCVERLSNQGPVDAESIKRLDESQYFVGIVTPQYRPLVDKEIRHALKTKTPKCLIYLRADCLVQPAGKLSALIKHIQAKTTYYRFDKEKQLSALINKQLPEMISRDIK